ncbi:MAG: hypothetical protein ACR2NU_08285 [Aeoliella sp.]
MSETFDTPELEAYLDEALPVDRMGEIEEALRVEGALREQLKAINGRRDAGVHSVGGIWRRHRLSCPSRSELGSYLLDVLSDAEAGYICFHLEISCCRVCAASVADLEAEQAAADREQIAGRRQKYYQSSVGHLPKE